MAAKSVKKLNKACAAGDLTAVRQLIERGASVNSCSSKGWTPIHNSSCEGHLAIVNFLLENGADVNGSFSPLPSSGSKQQAGLVHFLVSKGGKLEEWQNEGYSPLILASGKGHRHVVSCLLSQGADIHSRTNKGSSSIHVSSQEGHTEVVKCLLSQGADIQARNNEGYSPLHAASQSGETDTVNYLLSKGAEVNAKANDGYNGHTKVVNILLFKGAEVDARSNEGHTALHLASQEGHLQVAETLLRHGANLMATTNDGKSPLHSASLSGHTKVVNCLLTMGADVDASENNGFTALHCASQEGHLQVAETLLKHGANLKAKTNKGLTPVGLASLFGFDHMAKFLASEEARLNAGERMVGDIAAESQNNEKKPDTEKITKPDVQGRRAIVRYWYTAVNDDEVSFKVNDIITDIEEKDESWWIGTTQEGRRGKFPSSCIETLSELAENKEMQIPKDNEELTKNHLKKVWNDIEKQQLVETCLLRILMAGNYGYGKSSLARSLLINQAFMTSADDRTVVLDFWSWPVDELKTVTLFDLGGHKAYKQLAHLFHSNAQNNLTIIPHDATSNRYDITCSWISDISMQSPKGSIMMVLTKSDLIYSSESLRARKIDFCESVQKYLEREKRILQQNLVSSDHKLSVINKYRDLIFELKNHNILHVSCKTKEGLPELQKYISKMISKNENHFKIPVSVHQLYLKLGKLGVQSQKNKIQAAANETFMAGEAGSIKKVDVVATKGKKSVVAKLFPFLKKKKNLPISQKEPNSDKSEKMKEEDLTSKKETQELVKDMEVKKQLVKKKDEQHKVKHIDLPSNKLQYVRFKDAEKEYEEILQKYDPSYAAHQIQERLKSALQLLHHHGLITWYDSSTHLQEFIFNDLSSFVNLLRSLFHHSIHEVLSFDKLDEDLQEYVKFQELISKPMYNKMLDRLCKQGLLSKKLLKVFARRFKFEDNADILVDLLQHLNMAHLIPNLDESEQDVLLFPWYIEQQTVPEEVQCLVSKIKVSDRDSLSFHLELNEYVPSAFFTSFCVGVYKHLIPELVYTQECWMWSNSLFTQIDDTQVLIQGRKCVQESLVADSDVEFCACNSSEQNIIKDESTLKDAIRDISTGHDSPIDESTERESPNEESTRKNALKDESTQQDSAKVESPRNFSQIEEWTKKDSQKDESAGKNAQGDNSFKHGKPNVEAVKQKVQVGCSFETTGGKDVPFKLEDIKYETVQQDSSKPKRTHYSKDESTAKDHSKNVSSKDISTEKDSPKHKSTGKDAKKENSTGQVVQKEEINKQTETEQEDVYLDGIDIYLKCRLKPEAINNTWNYIRKMRSEGRQLKSTWWNGMLSDWLFTCPCVNEATIPSEKTHCWPIEERLNPLKKSGTTHGCPRDMSRRFPLAMINPLPKDPFEAGKCVMEIQEYLQRQTLLDKSVTMNTSDCYPMTPRKGLVVIMANFTEDLEGYKADIKKICSFFLDKLKYPRESVLVYRDLTYDQFMVALRDIQVRLNSHEWGAVDKIMFFILSHGNQVGINMCRRGSKKKAEKDQDGYIKSLPLSTITKMFEHHNVPSLKGLPKAFFVQACQGPKVCKAANVENSDSDLEEQSHMAPDVPQQQDSGSKGGIEDDPDLTSINAEGSVDLPGVSRIAAPSSSKSKVALGADILQCYACCPDTVSLVPDNGSVYIGRLLQEFEAGYQTKDVYQMLTATNDKLSTVRKNIMRSNQIVATWQMPIFSSTLTKAMRLQ